MAKRLLDYLERAGFVAHEEAAIGGGALRGEESA